MMQVNVETINGKKYTVVWHNPREHRSRHFSQIDLDCYANTLFGGEIIYTAATDAMHIATALPALPRKPKPEHAPLLYRYMAEGIYPAHQFDDGHGAAIWRDATKSDGKLSITHATYNGERCEIAIEGVI